jgi:hypothetical protein
MAAQKRDHLPRASELQEKGRWKAEIQEEEQFAFLLWGNLDGVVLCPEPDGN